MEKYFFPYLFMAKREKNIIKKIVSSIYKDTMQIRKKRDFFAFHKIDLSLLQFFNTIDCYRQLILIRFIDNFAYGHFVSNISYYNNCLNSLYENVNVEENFDMPK